MPDRIPKLLRHALWLSAALCCGTALACAGTMPTVAESDQAYARAESLQRGDAPQRSAPAPRYTPAPGTAPAAKPAYSRNNSRNGKNAAEAWLAHSRRARKLLAAGNTEEAESEFIAALDASQGLSARDVRSRTALTNVEHLADRYARTQDVQGTIRLMPQLIAGIERLRGPDDRGLSLAYQRLGQAQLSRENSEAAADALNRSLQYHEAGRGHSDSDIVEVKGSLAQSYEELGQYDAAESLHLSSLATCEARENEDQSLALALNRLAWFYTERDRHAEAEPLAQRAVEIVDRIEPPRILAAAVLDTLATAQAGTGQLEEADDTYTRAATSAKGTDAEAEILNKQADVLVRLGRKKEAKKLRDRADGIESPEPLVVEEVPASEESEETEDEATPEEEAEEAVAETAETEATEAAAKPAEEE